MDEEVEGKEGSFRTSQLKDVHLLWDICQRNTSRGERMEVQRGELGQQSGFFQEAKKVKS